MVMVLTPVQQGRIEWEVGVYSIAFDQLISDPLEELTMSPDMNEKRDRKHQNQM